MGFAVGIPSLIQANPVGNLYLKGSENVDGSIRIILDTLSDVAIVEERANGVWNPGEFQLAQGSLLLGREVRLSAVGHHLIVTTSDIVAQSMCVEQEFSNAGSGPPESTILGPLISRSIRQADNSVSLTLTDHSSEISSVGLLLASAVYVQTGATAASEDVQVVFSEGVPPNDIVFFRQNFPASKFPANAEVIVDISPGEFDPGVQINGFFTSVKPFTMRYDATATFLWFALDTQQQGHEDILTESLILTNDLGIVFNNAAELVRGNFVFI